MNCIKNALVCAVATGVTMFTSAAPEVSNVTMTQDVSNGRLVIITYNLTEDAVVTMDVQTNATPNAATGWASIGGEAVCNAQGAVWRKVTSADADGNGKYTITWRPDLSWADELGKGFKVADGCAKVVLTAWALNNTPNYMVVDISSAAQPNTQKYYPSVDFLPGGILGNPDYRTTSIVMRKIMAKDVEWTMGSTSIETSRTSEREATHKVTLTNNYYMGVFEVTQAQWAQVAVNSAQKGFFTVESSMRPMEQVSYNEIRNTVNSQQANVSYNWPANPNPSSFLGLLRSKTGIDDFDLPSEAQWEFAARAGNGGGYWGNGSAIKNTATDENLNLLGRYQYNGGRIGTNSGTLPAADCATANGTAIVGSYAPNAWGLYDVHGNVWEWCLDWFADDVTAYGGKVNINPATPANTLAGTEGGTRVTRGGSFANAAGFSRPANRFDIAPTARQSYYGFRVLCTAGLR